MAKKKAEEEGLEEEAGQVTDVTEHDQEELEHDDTDDGLPVVEFAVEDAEVPAHKWPLVLDGICEFCGCPITGDHKDQVGKPLFCKHYSKVKVVCSYCRKSPFNTDCQGRTFHIWSLTANPKVLIISCDDYRCMHRHQNRAKAGKV